jgi:membrane-associated phospholipid phosphatase
VRTATGQELDATSLGIASVLQAPHALLVSVSGLRTGLTLALLTVSALALVQALGLREWSRSIRAGLLVVLSAVGSELIKANLPRPDLGDYAYAYNSYPGVHVTISLAAVVATVWLAPRWLSNRVVVVLGAAAMLVGLASWVSLAHRASDVAGGTLLAAALAYGIGTVDLSADGERFARWRAWYVSGLVALAVAVVASAAALVVPAALVVEVLAGGVVASSFGIIATLLSQQRARAPVAAGAAPARG